MGTPEYDRWVARGRADQSQGRMADAMLCYQHAAGMNATDPDAHHHLGEVLWRLGRFQDAVAAWREAARRDVRSAASALALAEALLALGDLPGARAAAGDVLNRRPGDARAELAEYLALTLGENEDRQPAALGAAAALARDAGLLTIPALANSVALALDRLPEGTGKVALLGSAREAALASPSARSMPALLLALLCEGACDTAARATADAQQERKRADVFALAGSRAYEPGEHDALRRVANAALRGAPNEAPALAQSYASLCAVAFASAVPLVWPRRTAGRRLRVVALAGAAPDPEARMALATMSGLPADRFDVAIAVMGARLLPDALAATDASATPRVIFLPPNPDANDAKRLAALDPDVLIDLAGLRAGTGPLLARRPARTIVTVSDLAARNRPPLVDRGDTPVRELERMLAQLAHALPPEGEAPDAAAMSGLWVDAVRAHQQGDLAAARARYARVLAAQPGHALTHYLLGIVARDAGDLDGARSSLLAAVAAAPAFVDARVAAARVAQALDDLPGAMAMCAEGLAVATEPLALHRALGLARLAARDGRGAADAFAAALAIDPADGQTHYNHGVALQMQRHGTEAARAYQSALALAPDLVAAEFNLGVLFQEQGATAAAIAAYERVLAREPANAAAYGNLGALLLDAGRIDAWLANFDRFEAHCPDALALAVQALEVCQHRGDFAAVERYLAGLRAERFRADDALELCDVLEQLLYLLLFFDVEPALIFRLAQTYDATAQRVHGAPLARPAARRPGRIRIGYLGADLRNHVMGKMIWQAVRHHDRSRFALHFYSLSGDRDEWTERFAGIADRFEVLGDLAEREAAARIAADDLDLLVDLSTHTKGAKPGILALKPARVQITHVASAGTVGLSTIDFKLTDHRADVAENQADQIETLLPIDGCVYPYRHIPPAAAHPFRRSLLAVAPDAVLIGAFVAPLKLSRRCLGLWREVLARIPRARLALSPTHPAFRDSYARLAAAAGIGLDRLLFLPQGRDEAEGQARYELIDFVLDPMPFGGVNGTLEALDMGVPVVTLVGKRHGERSSFSILASLGVTQTLAQTGPEYVDIAVRLAADPVFVRDVRAAIRAGLAGSPLIDMPGHTRHLEAAYLQALRLKAPEALDDAQAATG